MVEHPPGRVIETFSFSLHFVADVYPYGSDMDRKFLDNETPRACPPPPSIRVTPSLVIWRIPSGMLSVKNLVGALCQLGVPINLREAEEVVAYYAAKGDHHRV